jgi:hypothetical protein
MLCRSGPPVINRKVFTMLIFHSGQLLLFSNKINKPLYYDEVVFREPGFLYYLFKASQGSTVIVFRSRFPKFYLVTSTMSIVIAAGQSKLIF